MTDYSKERYCEVITNTKKFPGMWAFKIYRYDVTGNMEIIVYKSDFIYENKNDAMDAAYEYSEDNGIDAEMS